MLRSGKRYGRERYIFSLSFLLHEMHYRGMLSSVTLEEENENLNIPVRFFLNVRLASTGPDRLDHEHFARLAPLSKVSLIADKKTLRC